MMGIAYPPAPMDGLAKWSTAFVLAIIACCGVMALVLEGQHRIGMLLVFALLAVLTFVVYLLMPWKYEIADDTIKVHRSRPFGAVIVPLAGIREIRMLDRSETNIWRMWKLWASGGASGWLRWRNWGRSWMSPTTLAGAVLLANGRKYIITPARPEEFVNEVKRRIGLG